MKYHPPHKCGLIKKLIKHELVEFCYRTNMMIQRRSPRYLGRVDWEIPKSENIQKILKLAKRLYQGPLFNHGIRSYAFGKILMTLNEEVVDNEVFFLGCLLHDLGLKQECGDISFEIVGAESACQHCKEFLNSEQLDIMHEMIRLHDAVGEAENKTLELKYLHYGAGVDVADLWTHRLNEKNYHEVFIDYPSENHIHYMIDLMKDRMNENPNMYLSTLINLGFYKKMKKHKYFEK